MQLPAAPLKKGFFMKKRLSIIGKGTAGSQAAMHFSNYMEDTEIIWYFDPNKTVQSVGEGSTLQLPRNMYHCLNFFNTDLKKINGTFKTGIYKKNWGQKNSSFFHNFDPPGTSYHFSAVELQNYIYENLKNKIVIIEKEVDYKNLDSDFIFNASGKPKNFEEFYISEYIPVNSAYVVQIPWDYPKFDYTLTVADKYGWYFGIPLQNRVSIGYIYNKNINSEYQIEQRLYEIVEEYNFGEISKTNKIDFKNYFRKNNYEDNGRIAHSGNASFFLEPLEATSIGTMDSIQRKAFDIWENNKNYLDANDEYLSLLNETEAMIMLHYASGSKFKTDFWEYAKSKGSKRIKFLKNDPKFKIIYNSIRDIKEKRFCLNRDIIPEYGPWWSGSYLENITGLGLFETLDEIIY